MIGDPLFDSISIAARVAQIGSAISQDYAGNVPVMVGMLAAKDTFFADLARAITIPCQLDVISVNRYGDGDGIVLEKDLAIPIERRHVILDVYKRQLPAPLLLRCLVAPPSMAALLGQSLLGIISPSNHPLVQVFIRM